MTTKQLIAQFYMEDHGSYHSCELLSWEDVYQRVAPAMQSEGLEPLTWYFIEDKPGGWKQPFGLVFWSRGAWTRRSECALITYYLGTLSVRTFDSEETLDKEVRAMKARLESR